ncbi:MAG: hypothetical protein PUC18_13235 [Prevotellaceae bacterium]|nr:hypothetical protein [Prevotellaceae bacterium]
MEDKKFYVTIEVTGQMRGEVSKDEIRRRVINFIHNEKQKENHCYAPCYLTGEHVMSVYDEKGNEL